MLKTAKPRASLKKDRLQKHWDALIKNGLEVLKYNPWDATTLTALAEATDHYEFDEVPLIYLRTALDANPKDPEINRLCAVALRQRGQFDQALACWKRVLDAKPGDEEAQHAIGELAVEKTIHQGGYEGASSSRDVRADKQTQNAGQAGPEISTVERLERQIQKEPNELAPYLELSEIHLRESEFEKAEDVLTRACEASGDDPDIQQRLRDAQLVHLRHKLSVADKKFKESGSEEDHKEYQALRKQFNLKKLEDCKQRCERYPNHLGFKFELGQYYQICGHYKEAIQQFQLAHNDPRRKGVCMLLLGQCFEKIKQYPLAKRHYGLAIDEIPDRDAENKKLALYQAGRLALGLKEPEEAEQHLTTLAGMDFAYKDVSTLLDKVTELRDNS